MLLFWTEPCLQCYRSNIIKPIDALPVGFWTAAEKIYVCCADCRTVDLCHTLAHVGAQVSDRSHACIAELFTLASLLTQPCPLSVDSGGPAGVECSGHAREQTGEPHRARHPTAPTAASRAQASTDMVHAFIFVLCWDAVQRRNIVFCSRLSVFRLAERDWRWGIDMPATQ